MIPEEITKKYSPRIGVLADDLTGAGDVGVQFADRGLKVKLNISVDIVKEIPSDTEVWIINTHSRGDKETKAAKKVKKALGFLKKWKAEYYYKKIDSTLRGPVGNELEAMLEELDIDNIPFCAAFPDMGRTTIESVHYVLGIPVGESVYSRDPEAPVRESNIKKLLASQMEHPEKIEAKDAATNDDLEKISRECSGKVFAGAAAWAGKLADRWLSSARKIQTVAFTPGSVLIVSGSLNPLSLEQIKHWEKIGRNSLEVSDDMNKDDIDFNSDLLVKTSVENIPSISKKINKTACDLWNRKKWARVILNGGNTAFEFVSSVGIDQLNVIKSLMPGIALIEKEGNYFVLKPGGYGQADTLAVLNNLLGGR
ncbi:four-carbon acid sugar kinase family protein [Elusimicrobiota bacterium]